MGVAWALYLGLARADAIIVAEGGTATVLDNGGVSVLENDRDPDGASLGAALDNDLIDACRDAIENRTPVTIERPIRNVNRTTGAMLSGRIAEKHGHAGLPPETVRIAVGFKSQCGVTQTAEINRW